MTKKIYVSNLPLSATEDEVRQLFSDFGTVEWVHLVTAAESGRSRGSGYVAMTNGAGKAIRRLDHSRVGDRLLSVRRALPLGRARTARPRVPKRARRWADAGRLVAAIA